METSKMTALGQTLAASCPPIQGDDEFRVLLYGIDNAYLSFGPEVTKATYEHLLEEQHQAQRARKERNAVYCSEWLNAKVFPGGANGFAIIIDKAGMWTIKLQKGNAQRPGLYLEMRSKVLHTHPEGAFAACEEAVTWIRNTLYADVTQEIRDQIVLGKEKLSRYDIHMDYQGNDYQKTYLPQVPLRQAA